MPNDHQYGFLEHIYRDRGTLVITTACLTIWIALFLEGVCRRQGISAQSVVSITQKTHVMRITQKSPPHQMVSVDSYD